MAAVLEWVPDSLYNTAISSIVTHYNKYRKELRTLTDNVQFDIFYKLYNKGRLCQLGIEFSELDVFAKVLKINDKRHLLHHCFQALMDHGVKVSEILSDAYCQRCCMTNQTDAVTRDKVVQLGFSLGVFLSDAGWFVDSEKVFMSCLQLCKLVSGSQYLPKTLECCVRLLHVYNANCKYDEALEIHKLALEVVEKMESHGFSVNKALLYSEHCALLFARSHYVQAFNSCCNALRAIRNNIPPPKALVDILRQSAKASVVKREFKKAEMLIKHAVHISKEHFGPKHSKYSDALLDYGFYLLNVDHISQAVTVLQAALDIRQCVFGGNNLHVAVAHEDLAYATYVNEYSSGKFSDAKDHAEKAICIITHILVPDHLLLASSKRVKALILEEIAIDSQNKEVEKQLLQEAHDLHHASLSLAKKAFGENNVQTAKHYGNLGRLYQSMHKYKEAEEMHLKAIAIKESLLGPEDYEVALSVGHLASLYNYDMKIYDKAEKLYLRSILIGRKLFGAGYSGLEYDYRGLLRLYHSLGDAQKAIEYGTILHQWNQIRDQNNDDDARPLDYDPSETTLEVINKFLEGLES